MLGYLQNNPVVSNRTTNGALSTPSGIDVAKDGNNYYAFAVNHANNNLIRFNFGTSLGNTPIISNLGSITNTVPAAANALYIIQDSGKWYIFVAGGTDANSSTLARFDFGATLANLPNGVNMGNPGKLLNAPRGLFVSSEAGNYYGFVVNSGAGGNNIVRFNFGNNISLTPTAVSLGNIGNLSGPSDIAAAYDNGSWYFLIPNQTSSTLSRIVLGNSLANAPIGNNLGTLNGTLFGPSAISLVKDCGGYYAFITDAVSSELTRVQINNIGSSTPATDFLSKDLFGFNRAFSTPSDISRVIRDHDNLFAYVVNAGTDSLTQVGFPQCTNTTIASSTSKTPPSVVYNTPGLYNVYLSINEGLPTAQMQCKQLRVLAIPPITLTDDTLICQGDTVKLVAQSARVISYTWSPNYNISGTSGTTVFAYPAYTVKYMLHIPYTYGCIVDTSITITVKKIQADAGPDRTLGDGASTILGGPNTSLGLQYTYRWTPDQFITNNSTATTIANPAYDLTYYLTVSDTGNCVARDTVIVHIGCNGINLPNAFTPDGRDNTNTRFGLLNRQIVQLNYFRIFDRWGREVFHTTDITNQWDGTVNGSPAPMGVYVWEADGFCTAGQRISRSGNVTLLR